MYIGRFAPTPSGDLHLGSLCVAIGSYLRAKSQQGKWLVRIEDLDLPRCSKSSTYSILKTLEIFHLEYDDEIVYQSARLDYYQQIIQELKQQNLIYPCTCSRARLKSIGGCYDGKCRNLRTPPDPALRCSWRFKNPGTCRQFKDQLRGIISINEHLSGEDFIVRRSDGTFAYNLAVVVDDAQQKITEVVRGADLIDVTTRQINLIEKLGYAVPDYLHLPLILTSPNLKYSKQNHAKAVSSGDPRKLCTIALNALGFNLPSEIWGAPLREQLLWAQTRFNIQQIPQNDQIINY